MHIFASTQKYHTFTKINDSINMDSTIAGSVYACSKITTTTCTS